MEIRFKSNRNGKKRAYRYSRPQMRWFPMPIVDAELLLATGTAFEATWNTQSENDAELRGQELYEAITA